MDCTQKYSFSVLDSEEIERRDNKGWTTQEKKKWE